MEGNRQYFSRLCELIRLVNLEDMLTVIRKYIHDKIQGVSFKKLRQKKIHKLEAACLRMITFRSPRNGKVGGDTINANIKNT